MIIQMGRSFANDHLDGLAFCTWSSGWAGLLQMIIWIGWPFANDHPDGPAFCKWSSGWASLFKEIFSKYFPHFPSLFFFSSRKKIFSFSEYHPSFSSPPEQKVNVNIAVFSFLHLIDRNKTKVIRIQIRYFQCFLGLVFFLLFWFFQDQVFRNRNQDLFFRDQIFRNRNPQKICKSLETEKFQNRNVNLCWTKMI